MQINSWNISEFVVEFTIWIINSPSDQIAAIILHLPLEFILIIELGIPIGSQL